MPVCEVDTGRSQSSLEHIMEAVSAHSLRLQMFCVLTSPNKIRRLPWCAERDVRLRLEILKLNMTVTFQETLVTPERI